MTFTSKKIWLILILALFSACVISQGVQAGTTVPTAEFAISDLAITPDEVVVNKNVTINATITNKSTIDGVYEATLTINGMKEATQSLDVPPKGIKIITFTISKDIAATYEVDVDGLKGVFTVIAKPTGSGEEQNGQSLMVAIVVGVIVVVAAGLLTFLVFKRKAARP